MLVAVLVVVIVGDLASIVNLALILRIIRERDRQ